MVDLSAESLLSLAEAAKVVPGRPHISTLHRWRLRGIRGVRLETLLVGGRRFTSREALVRFSAGTTAAANGDPTPCRTNRRRQTDIKRAEAELTQAGI